MKNKHTFLSAASVASCLVAFALGMTRSSVAQNVNSGITKNDIPRTLSYQGLVTNGDKPVGDGIHTIAVTLYGTDDASTPIWTGIYQTAIHGGVFNILLGSGDQPLPDAASMNRPLWVGVKLDGSPEISSLSQLTSSPYALNVGDNAITTAKLADNAVTKEKIGAEYVGSISINGTKIGVPGSNVNFVTGNGLDLAFDPATNTVLLSGQSKLRTKGKGSLPQYIGGDPTATNTDDGVTTGAGGNPASTNFVGGGQSNSAWPAALGPAPQITGWVTVGGGFTNNASDQYATIGGGRNNIANAPETFIGGGSINTISASPGVGVASVIGGGTHNIIRSDYSTTTGGLWNYVDGYAGAVGGGESHEVHGDYATVAGGYNNESKKGGGLYFGDYIAIPGGRDLFAGSYAQTVVGAWNIPPTPATVQNSMTPSDLPLFIVANGTSNVSRSHAFEVSYNGHATPMQVLGNFTGLNNPVKGGRYNDNAMDASGVVNIVAGVATVPTDFGVVGAAFTPPNTITVFLNYPPGTLTNASIVANVIETGCPDAAGNPFPPVPPGFGAYCTVTPIGCFTVPPPPGAVAFDVNTYSPAGPGAYAINFHVSGR